MVRNLWPPGVARMTEADAIREVSGQKESKYTIIPAGYRLSIDSWENDADNRRTLTREGLTFAECSLYLDLCRLLLCKNDPDNPKFGNMYEPDHADINEYQIAVLEILKKHKASLPPDVDLSEEVPNEKYSSTNWSYYVNDIISDYFGSSEYYYTRVLEDFKVEYFPEEVKILDVSDQFKE